VLFASDIQRPAISSGNWATAEGATFWWAPGTIGNVGSRPPRQLHIHDGAKVEFQQRLVIGDDGRNSSVGKDLGLQGGMPMSAQPSGGMIVKGVQWARANAGESARRPTSLPLFPQRTSPCLLWQLHFVR